MRKSLSWKVVFDVMSSDTNLYFLFLLKLKLQNASNKDTFHCISDELSLVDALISIIITSFQYLLSAAAYILESKLKVSRKSTTKTLNLV